jgi:ABC-type antimicrobial peptide transport system permease subunit
VLPFIEKLWNENFPDYVYEYKFLDQTIADFYKNESRLSILYKIFAGLAIFISCLGLYGLVSFMALQRTKEMGIRKVLGASARNIVYLLSREFTLLIIIAFVIAAPIGYFTMQGWLQNYSYRIQLGASVFLLAIAGSIIISWITVGYRAIKAALANPVKSLRTEG